ncbi:hypothetical protein [Flavobacterium seoulense]|uniref:Uncharacterized protein n=1 Tax=Flavobacterium seoulense TaxID=1492738 RepID=A0A066WRY9_9FLAO|nr:hypothetical protein [Flavobacterium seoulense]KDN56581.1 hypothetical protein FEM21_00840 [Flavobacterium seoulense]
MKNEIRKFPLFELYVENNFLIINNHDYAQDNGIIDLSDILEIKFLKQQFDFIEYIIAFVSGINIRKRSDKLQIKMKNGIKEILLTNCDINKVQDIINIIKK